MDLWPSFNIINILPILFLLSPLLNFAVILMKNHFKTSLDRFLLFPPFIEIVLWTDLMSLSKKAPISKASISTLLTCSHVSLVKKMTRHITNSRGIPLTVVGNLNSEGNQYWDSCGISKTNKWKRPFKSWNWVV